MGRYRQHTELSVSTQGQGHFLTFVKGFYEVQSESSRTVLVVLFKSKLCILEGKTFFYTTIYIFSGFFIKPPKI